MTNSGLWSALPDYMLLGGCCYALCAIVMLVRPQIKQGSIAMR